MPTDLVNDMISIARDVMVPFVPRLWKVELPKTGLAAQRLSGLPAGDTFSLSVHVLSCLETYVLYVRTASLKLTCGAVRCYVLELRRVFRDARKACGCRTSTWWSTLEALRWPCRSTRCSSSPLAWAECDRWAERMPRKVLCFGILFGKKALLMPFLPPGGVRKQGLQGLWSTCASPSFWRQGEKSK